MQQLNTKPKADAPINADVLLDSEAALNNGDILPSPATPSDSATENLLSPRALNDAIAKEIDETICTFIDGEQADSNTLSSSCDAPVEDFSLGYDACTTTTIATSAAAQLGDPQSLTILEAPELNDK